MNNIGLWLCRWMGWHKKPFVLCVPDKDAWDGDFPGNPAGYPATCNPYEKLLGRYQCERCKVEGFVDSQGNLF